MMQWTMFYLLTMFSFMFMYMKHPLAMGLTLLIQTTLICLTSGISNKSFWFSYILFLVFLGGMLVLFIYVTSLASNEMFSFSTKMLIFSLSLSMMMMIMMIFMDKNLMMNYLNLEIKSTFDMNSFMPENSLSLNKLYNFPTNLMNIMLMNYLLITLIVIVKITNLSKGPLRPMFN